MEMPTVFFVFLKYLELYKYLYNLGGYVTLIIRPIICLENEINEP